MDTPTNKCSSCGLPKPLTTEHWHWRNDRQGWRRQCKQCLAEAYDKRRAKNPGQYWANQRTSIRAHVGRLLRNTKKKHPDTPLTLEYLLDLYDSQEGRCYYTGIKMELSTEARHPWQPSLDRVDPAAGYHPGNVVWTAWTINAMKGTQSAAQFRETLERLQQAQLPNPAAD